MQVFRYHRMAREFVFKIVVIGAIIIFIYDHIISLI